MASFQKQSAGASTKHRSPCPLACSLDWLGDRWSLLIIRDLISGKSKFQQLLESHERITTNVLSDRLKKLEEIGLISRYLYQDHPPRAEYFLTPEGKSLLPVVKALYDWGAENIPGAHPNKTILSRIKRGLVAPRD
jgi:DNA-binding HxlR family transcriptional regulator